MANMSRPAADPAARTLDMDPTFFTKAATAALVGLVGTLAIRGLKA